jgi:predicted RND superfamily exporter protein
MGAFHIALDTGTALISAVALGIAVDDTIHFLSEYRVQRGNKNSVSQSLSNVISVKGRAILSSSLILCIGFGVIAFSRFAPVMNFGILLALIMMTALIGDLLVLPAILLLRKDRKETAPMTHGSSSLTPCQD